MALEENTFNGYTLKPQLYQVREFTRGRIRKAIVDRGYKVKDTIGITEVVSPNTRKKESYYLKQKRIERCRFRVGIEGLISHRKHDHRRLKNYLKGTAGDKINSLQAAVSYNMIKWMRMKSDEILFCFYRLYVKAR